MDTEREVRVSGHEKKRVEAKLAAGTCVPCPTALQRYVSTCAASRKEVGLHGKKERWTRLILVRIRFLSQPTNSESNQETNLRQLWKRLSLIVIDISYMCVR